MARLSFLVGFLLGTLSAVPAHAQPVSRECSAPALEIFLHDTVRSDVIEITDSVKIQSVEVRLDLTTTSTSRVSDIRVISPSGTAVVLHAGGGDTPDFDCTYTDVGRPNPAAGGNPSLEEFMVYDCAACPMQTSAGDAMLLADFTTEESSGDWELRISSQLSAATLNLWCITIHSVAPVSELSCRRDRREAGVAKLSWRNEAAYDSVRVYWNGELAEELAGPFDAGTLGVWSSAVAATPQIVVLSVAGVIDGVEGAANRCTLVLPAAGTVVSETLAPPATVDASTGYYFLGRATFADDVEISDIMVHVDASTESAWYTLFSVASSSGTSVTLYRDSFSPAHADDFALTFWEMGVTSGSEPLDCGCYVQPTGPGSLLDFAGESTIAADGDAEWTFTAEFVYGPGSVRAYGIEVFETAFPAPPSDLVCELDGDDDGGFDVTWINGADYESVQVWVNEELAAEQAGPFARGSEGSFSARAASLPAGIAVCVRGTVASGGSSARSCCSVVSAVPPVTGLTCRSASGTGVVTSTWTNGAAYDELAVYVNGVLDSTLAGSETGYTTRPFPVPGTATVAVEGLWFEPQGSSHPARCHTMLLDTWEAEACAAPSGDDVTTSVVTVDEALAIEQVQVLVDYTSRRIGHTVSTVTDPSGTSLALHFFGGPIGTARRRFYALFADDAEAPHAPLAGGVGFDCACILPPQEPAGFAMFDGANSAGDWELRLDDLLPASDPDIDFWCVRIRGCPTLAPSGLECEVSGQAARLAWTNETEYDEVRVRLDGGVIATLDGAEDSFRVGDLGPGLHRFSLQGWSDRDSCGGETDPCRVYVGFQEFCAEAPVLASPGLVIVPVDVPDPMVIGELAVSFGMSTFWAADSSVDLVSPFGTRVILHRGSDLAGDGFAVVWRDTGAAPSAPYDCGYCEIAPYAPLAELAGEISDGEWTVEVESNHAGVITEACLAILEGCAVRPPSAPRCGRGGTGIELTWANNDRYDSIRITRDGDLLVDGLAGDSESYTDEWLAAGFYRYRVFGVSDSLGCASGSPPTECAKDAESYCDETVLDLDYYGSTTTVEVPDGVVVDEVQAFVNIMARPNYVLSISLTSPTGVEVALYAGGRELEGDFADMNATFADVGDQQPPSRYDCGGCLLAPSGPGVLADLVTDAPEGEWILAVTTPWGRGNLHGWCLRFLAGCALPRPELLQCAALFEDTPEVVVTWGNTSEADEITVLRDEVAIATLAADSWLLFDEGTEPGLLPGYHEYQILAASERLECLRPSVSCLVAVGRLMSCNSTLTIPSDHELVTDVLTWSRDDWESRLADVGQKLEIREVELEVSVNTDSAGSLALILESPAGTRVQLSASRLGGGISDDLRVTFSDRGVALTSSNTACGCLVHPWGPRRMADFAGENPVGDWSLAASASRPSTIVRWCVAVMPTAFPPVDRTQFKRGDVDGNGSVVAIVDALRLLEWFTGSAAEPPCMDAADVSDIGAANSLAAAVRLLGWAFSEGATPPPPAPGPDVCGEDPTPDSLGCVTEAAACDW